MRPLFHSTTTTYDPLEEPLIPLCPQYPAPHQSAVWDSAKCFPSVQKKKNSCPSSSPSRLSHLSSPHFQSSVCFPIVSCSSILTTLSHGLGLQLSVVSVCVSICLCAYVCVNECVCLSVISEYVCVFEYCGNEK